ncbi:MAG: PUR family DNA/RNA-binding protein [Verrucomicrobiae bacterium]|nr:PUR family DNA/RNA-binding protein [Verrucomicrobiae bacterium]
MAGHPRSEAVNDALHSEKVLVERKQFFFDLKQNARGRFLRITEDVNGRRNAIVVPTAGLEDFRRVLGEIIEQDKRLA